ncbi:polyketide synthase [Mycolicibacterium iranicum]|uniref:Phthioceranic/hydroxyphthioceranic acid synthase n=2 Tax=Mycolicibacterium iranicum TaxID=912594 RepID=A0A178LE20_MYCIR|nr:polyketide synthase [Mycolicibacterium iranicum]
MGCRLPGGIESPQRLWDALLAGADLVTEVPSDRWDADEFYDPEPGVPGRSVSKWGGFLDDVSGFDAGFFGIAEREATAIDPQHRLLLEASWEAVEHAGIDPATLAGTQTGVFVGMTHNDYQLITADADAIAGPYGFTGSNYGLASGRIAYHLGAHGPACTVDSACSSGLLAVHMACRSLHDGESSLALAGGVNVLLEPRKLSSGSAQGMLSPTGRCRSFDADADGFVSGEAAVMLLFKRLPDALRDGDRVLAVVRGTATNQDGHTVNIATPSRAAQIAVYRSALAAADIDPATVGYVEAHGTGTPVGDPIEYASLAEVYGTTAPCALGSAKTNFGHSQSASGVVGLMKAALALGHAEVPPSLHFQRLSDETAKIDTALFVPQDVTAWPETGDHPRRAAVSSYGLSGTNVHVVLEQAPDTGPTSRAGQTIGAPWLFPLSATSPEALCSTASQLADWVRARSDELDLRDLAYTLARRRAHRTVRTAVLAGTAEELVSALRAIAAGDAPPQATVPDGDRGPVWVFSGQGSQWSAMGAALLAGEPRFAAAIAEIEPLIAAESGFSVTDAVTAAETVTGIDRVQPAVFAFQVALARTLAAYGVHPSAVIGHSMGEVAAAVVSEALSLEDGVKVICRRSRLMQRVATEGAATGAMASVELPAQQVLSELAARGAGDVVLSVIASPQSAVIGGARSTISALVQEWEDRGVMAREVAVEVASHSPQVDPILDDLTEALADLNPADPTIPYYSATLYDPREFADFDAYYWADNLRHAVRFAAAVQAALEDGHRVFAELSPHPLLTHAVDQNAKSLDVSAIALATLRRAQDLPHGLREVLADLYSAGAAIDFAALYPEGTLIDAPLPTWARRQLMLSRDTSRPVVGAASNTHPLLGAHVRLAEDPERHVWRADIGTDTHPWLADHRIHHVAAYPAAAYCEMAIAAARTVFGDTAEVRDISFEAALLLDGATSVAASASRNGVGVATFTVDTHVEGERVRHAGATLVEPVDLRDSAPRDVHALLAAHPGTVAGDSLRAWFDERGVQYGPAFAGLSTVHTAEDGVSVLAEVALPGSLRSQQSAYSVQPALLDACFQAVAAHPDLQADRSGTLMLPLGIRHVRVFRSLRGARYCHICVTEVTPAGVDADLEVLDGDGAVLMSLSGLHLGAGLSASARREKLFNDRLLSIDWHRAELPKGHRTGDGRWLVISTSRTADGRAGELAAALRDRGADVSTAAWPVEGIAHQAITGVVAVVSGQGAEAVSGLVDVARCVADIAGAPPRLYALTTHAQSVSPDDEVNLGHAGVRGLMRVIGVEHPGLRATQIDVDALTELDLVAAQLVAGSDEDETAWRDGAWYAARLKPGPVRPEDRYTRTVKHDSEGMRLRIRTPGDLQSLELVAAERTPPGSGEVEVMVTASNLNFADVLVAYGRYPSFEGRLPELGADFAGVVTRVGPGVTTHQVGDRVAGITADGAWATYVTCDADMAVTLPTGLAEDRAAAVPSAHATAWYSLHDLARISSTDKVLIHSATGGVGQAAIAIARAAGAQIFATAGSHAKRELLRSRGIDHVYDSRSTDFADQIRLDTGGYGVDIVVNSLPGAAQQAGLELLAFGGRFVEIGKRDIYGNNTIGLYAFRRNLSFFAVDLALLTLTRPPVVRRVLETVFGKIADGDLPLPETTHFPLADAATAIRTMGAAEHTGKLVLDVPREGHSRVVVPPAQAVAFRRDGSYLLSGGLGGLGLFVAERLAELGCGRIVLTGRSEPADAALAVLERIRAGGTEVEICLGDISEPAAAERAVAVATSTGRPVRGVLHAAAVVEDAALTNITDDVITRCWAPKVAGAWNLHEATVGQPLDWFCMFSSAAALVGSPGQGAYAAANSWLDAFTHWRRARGLTATTIAWGPWAEIGKGQALAQNSQMAIAPSDGAYALESLLRLDRGYSGYAPIAGEPWITEFAQHSTFAEAFRTLGETRSRGSAFLMELRTLPPQEWVGRLRRLIVDQIGIILRRTVDPDRPIAEYGLDSLGVLEVRTRIEAETGVRVATTDITTVRALAENLAAVLTEEVLVDGSAH